jgi:hypothetical protein
VVAGVGEEECHRCRTNQNVVLCTACTHCVGLNTMSPARCMPSENRRLRWNAQERGTSQTRGTGQAWGGTAGGHRRLLILARASFAIVTHRTVGSVKAAETLPCRGQIDLAGGRRRHRHHPHPSSYWTPTPNQIRRCLGYSPLWSAAAAAGAPPQARAQAVLREGARRNGNRRRAHLSISILSFVTRTGVT